MPCYDINNHHLMTIIHDKLQPLGLSGSESLISFNALIDRQISVDHLPIMMSDDELSSSLS